MQDGKIGTQAVQNATLAGAVAVGATAGFLGPFGAGALGMMAGALQGSQHSTEILQLSGIALRSD